VIEINVEETNRRRRVGEHAYLRWHCPEDGRELDDAATVGRLGCVGCGREFRLDGSPVPACEAAWQ